MVADRVSLRLVGFFEHTNNEIHLPRPSDIPASSLLVRCPSPLPHQWLLTHYGLWPSISLFYSPPLSFAGASPPSMPASAFFCHGGFHLSNLPPVSPHIPILMVLPPLRYGSWFCLFHPLRFCIIIFPIRVHVFLAQVFLYQPSEGRRRSYTHRPPSPNFPRPSALVKITKVPSKDDRPKDPIKMVPGLGGSVVNVHQWEL